MSRVLTFGAVLVVLVSGAGGVVAADAAGSSFASGTADTSQAAPAGQNDRSAAAQVKGDSRNGNLRFDFRIQSIERCGLTCRDVTVAATNTKSTTARNVTFVTKMYAGDTLVWRGNETFRKVEPGETKTTTKRVNLGLVEAAQVRGNGGYVTAETNVTWNSGNESFSERRKVT
ncbi:hypothetical protein [Halopelagius longus]|uniref:Uncharacterized protein n=1 Tax=Halopelagius longus TaxID=1236180 RepID=A0A1H1DQG6_9EURY|nr:hypothetical protein [Halopelagius longus]RDI71426.1 hypothetical protein DWB78_06645 [Halopelagius longus]SDQ78653.1 hypothetical protein SAMN05216278_2527 [Halopelagius longus]